MTYSKQNFIDAIYNNDIILVKKIINNCNESFIDDYANIKYACKEGLTEIVEILIKNPNINFNNEHECIYFSFSYEHVKILKLLLEDGRANPIGGESDVIYHIMTFKNYTGLDILLSDIRFYEELKNRGSELYKKSIHYRKEKIKTYLL